ncbi:DoxX family protein [Flavobacterium pectinovorum]|uniref:DoxX family protein n=1 Tax=Flavobacterium pectinovorum TaxID=29533 RepID=UPI001FAB833B|nr:DoxX family protein [Flavobacterium pectinovorum]MCI9845982.1 DoxX family protein [Flavobacterium pectinovorum]
MKTKKYLITSFIILTTTMVVLSGLMKSIHLPWSVNGLVKFNLPNAATVLGLMEITFAVLFVFPKTMRIGFILLSCYFAGAMATELSNDGSMLNPAVPLSLIWITAFFRDKYLFIGSSEPNVKIQK